MLVVGLCVGIHPKSALVVCWVCLLIHNCMSLTLLFILKSLFNYVLTTTCVLYYTGFGGFLVLNFHPKMKHVFSTNDGRTSPGENTTRRAFWHGWADQKVQKCVLNILCVVSTRCRIALCCVLLFCR